MFVYFGTVLGAEWTFGPIQGKIRLINKQIVPLYLSLP